jgi:hypothetical protein
VSFPLLFASLLLAELFLILKVSSASYGGTNNLRSVYYVRGAAEKKTMAFEKRCCSIPYLFIVSKTQNCAGHLLLNLLDLDYRFGRI